MEFEEVIDWTKVPVDTKVLVSDDGVNWYKRYFAGCKKEEVHCFNYGASSFSVDDDSNIVSWKYAKLYQE